jgi:hypothetical protein
VKKFVAGIIARPYSRRLTGILVLVGVLVGVTVGGGVGVIAASTSKSVTVCVDKNDQHMNYSNSGNCKSHQIKLVLNQTGVKGDTNGTLAITQQSVCDGSDADTVANEVCKVGMTGPGGGLIFFD